MTDRDAFALFYAGALAGGASHSQATLAAQEGLEQLNAFYTTAKVRSRAASREQRLWAKEQRLRVAEQRKGGAV